MPSSDLQTYIRSRFPFILSVAVVAVWGETFVSSKILLGKGLSPADIFFYRFTIAYVFMAALSHKRMWADSLKDEFLLALSGICGGSLYFLTENLALKYSTASNVAILIGITPLVTALLLAGFYKDERMSRRQLAGSFVAFCGLVLVVLNGRMVLHLHPKGDALALSAALLWGIYSLLMKNITSHYDPKFITRKVFAYGLLTILPWFALACPLQTGAALLSDTVVWGNLLYLGTVASLLCYLLWNWVLPKVGVVKSTNVLYTQSAFTMIISSAVLDERITMMAVTGTAIMICGMVFVSRKPHAKATTA